MYAHVLGFEDETNEIKIGRLEYRNMSNQQILFILILIVGEYRKQKSMTTRLI